MSGTVGFLDAFGYFPNLTDYADYRGWGSEQYDHFAKENEITNIVMRYLPIVSNILGVAQIKFGINVIKDGGTSAGAGYVVRGVCAVLFLGTAILWLVDLIVTLGRYLSMQYSNPAAE